MKVSKIQKNKIIKQTTKKTVDGIIDVLLRMWEADERHMTFENFCIDVMFNMDYETFYNAPIAPKKD